MAGLTPDQVQPWIAARILQFFNQVTSISEITRAVKDDPRDGPGNAIGHTVAKRIMEVRGPRPFPTFRSLDQLFEIDGLGSDKLEDLVYTFGVPAAKAFQDAMYDNQVISRANWPLEFHSARIEPYEEFEATARDDKAFRTQIMQQLQDFCQEKGVGEEGCQKMIDGVGTAYIDSYHNTASDNPAYAFAQWFYRIDLGNFFFFEAGIPQTRNYFEYHAGNRWEMELRLFKGVRSTLIPGGLVPTDLAVVVNHTEQVYTIWTTALFD